MIVNHAAERVKSKATERDIRAALDALDLDAIPPEKRARAVTAALTRVMLATTTDPRERAKDAFVSARETYKHVAGLIL